MKQTIGEQAALRAFVGFNHDPSCPKSVLKKLKLFIATQTVLPTKEEIQDLTIKFGRQLSVSQKSDIVSRFT